LVFIDIEFILLTILLLLEFYNIIMGYKEIGYLIIYRVIIGLLTRNYEHPDEYWQGTEIAHRLYYGYGYLTWEWTI
jgi:phosphatidylinositol glycan class B